MGITLLQSDGSKSAFTKSRASNGAMSCSDSPVPMNTIGTSSSCFIAKAIPPRAVPSNLARNIPVKPTASLNALACDNPFKPVVASNVCTVSYTHLTLPTTPYV